MTGRTLWARFTIEVYANADDPAVEYLGDDNPLEQMTVEFMDKLKLLAESNNGPRLLYEVYEK